jgi:hypothetical protein
MLMPTESPVTPQGKRRQGIGVASCVILVGMQNARTAPSRTIASARTCRRGSHSSFGFARYGGCSRSASGAKSGHRGVSTIFETSNLDTWVMASRPSAAHKPQAVWQSNSSGGQRRENGCSGNRLPATAFNKAKLYRSMQFVRAVRNTIQGQFGVVRLRVKGDCNAVGCLNEYSNFDVNRLRNSEFGPS